MSSNYEGRFVKTAAPVQLKEAKKKIPFRRRVTQFRRAVKRNRFYRWVLCALTCVVVFSSGRIYQSSIDKEKYTEAMEAQKIDIVTNYEGRLAEMQQSHENELYGVRAEYENLTPEELLKQEGEYLARMLYGTALNHDERDQRSAIWCALNRVDSPGFPNSVKEVCQQASQWIGYSDDNPILNDLYELAIEELTTWHNNYRPVNKDYVYMSWSSKEIKLRDTYEKSDNTRYWQAG